METFGFDGYLEPEGVNVNLDGMIELFKAGYQQFSSLWREIFCAESFAEISRAAEMDPKGFHLSTDAWVRILYELAATFHLWAVNRNKLLDLMTPLYFARGASFVRQSREMSSREAEVLVEEQAIKFEEQKDYLIRIWEEKSEQKTKATA